MAPPGTVDNQLINKKNLLSVFKNYYVSVQEGGLDMSSILIQDGVNRGKLKPIIVGTYDSMTQIINKFSHEFKNIIIDEAQEIVGETGRNISYYDLPENKKNDYFKKLDAYLEIIKKAPGPGVCGISLLTGSMHENTIELLKTSFNSEYKRDFEVIRHAGSADPRNQAFNRSTIVLVPFEKMKTKDQKMEIIKNAVLSKKQRNVMIIFSKNRSSSQGIFRILEDLVPSLPKVKAESLYSGADKVDVPILSAKKQTKGHAILKTVSDLTGDEVDKDLNVFDLMTDEKTKRGFKKNVNGTLVDLDNSDISNMTEIEFLKYFDIESSEKRGETQESALLTVADPTNLLYQSVLSGVGFIVGNMHKQHKATVQKLFRNGRIYFLLATNSVGIGANIKCEHLYMPSFEKMGDVGFQKIDGSSLIQILNRAGRGGDIASAYIYVPLQELELARKIMARDADPASLGETLIHPIPFGDLEKYLKEYPKLSKTKELLKSLINI
jgi:hypothetical protein